MSEIDGQIGDLRQTSLSLESLVCCRQTGYRAKYNIRSHSVLKDKRRAKCKIVENTPSETTAHHLVFGNITMRFG